MGDNTNTENSAEQAHTVADVLAAHFVMLHDLPPGDGPPHEWRCACGAKFGFSDSAIDHVADQVERREASGPGWFWTRDEWAAWSNELAMCLPEEYDDDGAQESIILRALQDFVTMVEDVKSVLGEYDDAGVIPAPYTNERALYERMCAALGRDSNLSTPPGSPTSGGVA